MNSDPISLGTTADGSLAGEASRSGSSPAIFADPVDCIAAINQTKVAAQFIAVMRPAKGRGRDRVYRIKEKIPRPSKKNITRANEMAALYAGGKTLQEIGDKFGVTRERVRQVIRGIGVESFGLRSEHRRKQLPLTAQQKRAVEMYRAGTPPVEIQRREGIGPASLHHCLAKAGVKSRGKAFWSTRKDDAWLTYECTRRWLAGEKAVDIAAAVGLNFGETVFRYLNKGGVEKSRRGKPRPRQLAAGRAMPVVSNHPPIIDQT